MALARLQIAAPQDGEVIALAAGPSALGGALRQREVRVLDHPDHATARIGHGGEPDSVADVAHRAARHRTRAEQPRQARVGVGNAPVGDRTVTGIAVRIERSETGAPILVVGPCLQAS